MNYAGLRQSIDSSCHVQGHSGNLIALSVTVSDSDASGDEGVSHRKVATHSRHLCNAGRACYSKNVPGFQACNGGQIGQQPASSCDGP